MKARILFVLMALMSLAIFAPAQTVPPHKTPPAKKKALPARDPKTGRFLKKTDSKVKKTTPLRDPKTGRFLKKPPVKPGKG